MIDPMMPPDRSVSAHVLLWWAQERFERADARVERAAAELVRALDGRDVCEEDLLRAVSLYVRTKQTTAWLEGEARRRLELEGFSRAETAVALEVEAPGITVASWQSSSTREEKKT